MKKNYYSSYRYPTYFLGINWGFLARVLLVVALIVGAIIGLVMAAPYIWAFVVDSFHAIQIPLLTITAIGMFGSLFSGIICFCNKKDDAGSVWIVITGVLFLLGYAMTRL